MVVVLVMAVGLWWLMRPMSVVSTEKISVVSQAGPAKPNLAAPAGQIVAPKIAPVAKTENSATAATPSAESSGDPRASLKTAIPDIVGLIRAGQEMTLLQTYTRPEKLGMFDLSQIQASYDGWRNDSDPYMQQFYRQRNADSALYWESLETQTATFNDAGDEATYTSDVEGALLHAYPVTFVKVSGKWYLKGMVYLAPLQFQL